MRPLTESLAMPGSSRLRRSVLYMPGANSRALEKARTLPCDGVILDLEDAVAPDAKAKARQQIAEALTAGGYGTREVVVRINSLMAHGGARIWPPSHRAVPMRSCCQRWKARSSFVISIRP
nr:aldolase/citrate lyase family protein [Iodidimonas gelatinilytica]